jgi:hypothetical protein
MSEHPHTIDNGGEERLTFVGVGRDERGEYLEIRNSVDPGAGPPMHVPVILAIGRALGWQRRFAGAPEPVRRP